MTCRRSHSTVSALALAVVVTMLGPVGLSAHEIGTSRVGVTFRNDGRYRIEVVTDAPSLLEKLEVASGRSRSDASEPADIQHRLAALIDLFTTRVTVSFDAERVQPSVTLAVEGSSDVAGVPAAVIVLSGVRPPAARSFTWAFGWTFASYALSVRTRDDVEPATEWIEGDATSTHVALDVAAASPSRLALAARYVRLGFTHIVPHGIDHVLFVLGVFLLSRKLKPILLQVSAFTIAHSITLGLSMYGIVSLAPSIVEPLIALSIVYVAVENLLVAEFRPRRVALVFAFGLLHGLGFAGALREVGLPRAEIATALVGFNVGVELGQLAVIATAFLAVGHWYGERIWYRQRIVLPASACIACIGMFWALERLHFR